MDKEVAQFTLLSEAANSTNSTKTQFYFNNVDLQALLGTMWNKYSKFKLCCYSIANNTSGLSLTEDDKNVNVYLSGLPFEFPYYNPSTNSFNNETLVGTFTMYSNFNQQNLYPTNDGIVFRKEQNLANLKIDVRRTKDDTNTFSIVIGRFAFSFIVYGIEE